MAVQTVDALRKAVDVCPETTVVEIKSPGPDGEEQLVFSVT